MSTVTEVCTDPDYVEDLENKLVKALDEVEELRKRIKSYRPAAKGTGGAWLPNPNDMCGSGMCEIAVDGMGTFFAAEIRMEQDTLEGVRLYLELVQR